jgi:hypothetical protein
MPRTNNRYLELSDGLGVFFDQKKAKIQEISMPDLSPMKIGSENRVFKHAVLEVEPLGGGNKFAMIPVHCSSASEQQRKEERQYIGKTLAVELHNKGLTRIAALGDINVSVCKGKDKKGVGKNERTL